MDETATIVGDASCVAAEEGDDAVVVAYLVLVAARFGVVALEEDAPSIMTTGV